MENLTPVKVDIDIETASIEQSAFYSMCFIAENDISPREIKVNTLSELLDNGYSRLDLVYNFCVGVFSQQSMPSVYIRAKRSGESYIDAYNSGNNDTYYFLVLQTKDTGKLNQFNSYITSTGDLKLHFYSQKTSINSNKHVNYYQDYSVPKLGVTSKEPDYYLNKSYGGREVVRIWASALYPVLVEKEDISQPSVIPLDISLERILKDTSVDEDFYLATAKPIDILLKKSVEDKFLNIEGGFYTSSVKPIDITMKSLLMTKHIDGEYYQANISPLDITLNRLLIKHFEDDKYAYSPSVKPLNITLKTGT